MRASYTCSLWRMTLLAVITFVPDSLYSQILLEYPASEITEKLRRSRPEFPEDVWHEGKIVLDSRDTLRGYVKYSLQNDLVQFQANSQIKTYTTRKIFFFEIYDKSVKDYRQFYSLPYAIKGQYKTPTLFELLVEGKMTLLAREAIEYKTFSSPYFYGTYTQAVLVHKYFFLKDDGSIELFNGKKNDLLDRMGARGDDVEQYIKDNHLDYSNYTTYDINGGQDRKRDLVRIVQFYNSFFK